MKDKILLLFCLFANQFLNAQETKSLTLNEALSLSIKNSHTLKLSEAKILAANATIQEALERKLPDASISGSYLYLPFKPNIDLKLGSNAASTPVVHQILYGSANASLPLFAGGKIHYGIESAKYLAKAAQLDASNDSSAVILNTIAACINLFKSYEAIGLVKENQKQAKERVNDFKNLEKNGIVARNDLLKVELQTSQLELTLLDAESNYKMACMNMNSMMGLAENTILFPDQSGLALPNNLKTVTEYETIALKNRADLNAITERKKAAEIGVKATKSDIYPNLALSGGYFAADIPKLLTVFNALNIGLGVHYNIAALWKNKAKINQAKAMLSEIEQTSYLLNDKISLQINQAYQTFLVSKKKIEVYENSVQQASENYRITKNKFDNALATTSDLLEADVALLQSKLSVTNAKADAYLAYRNLLITAGIFDDKQ